MGWTTQERPPFYVRFTLLVGVLLTFVSDRLQANEIETTIPTIGFNVETLQYKNIKFQVWDLGGQTSIRPYWRYYYPNTDAIIFVVDSADRERLKIAKQELFAMLEVTNSQYDCSRIKYFFEGGRA